MSRNWQLALGIALLVGWLPALSLWFNPPPLIGDEAYYARVPVEMRERGDWIVPYFNGEPRYKKPPLMYWLVALSQAIFGENEFASRLPSFIAVALSGLLLAWFGFKVGVAETGLWSTTAFLLNPMTAVLGNWGAPEATLCLFVTASVLFGFLWLHNGMALHWLILSGVSAGLGILTKGAPGIVLPAVVLFPAAVWRIWILQRFESALQGGKRVFAHLALWLAICLVIVSPWFVAVWLQEGEKFWQVFLLREHIRRVAEPMEGHRGPIWFYLPIIWLLFTPWSICLPNAFTNALKMSRESSTDGFRSLDLPMAWWAFSVVALFSLIATKLPHYIFPALPAIAWLAASQAQRRLSEVEFWLGLILAALPVPFLFYGSFFVTEAYGKFLGKMGFKPGTDLDELRIALYILLIGFASVPLIWGLSKTFAGLADSGGFAEKKILVVSGMVLTIVTLVSVSVLAGVSGGRYAINAWTKFQNIASFGSDTEWTVFYAKRPVPMLGRNRERLHEFLTKYPDAAILARVDFAPVLKCEGLTVVRSGIWCVAFAKKNEISGSSRGSPSH